MSKRYVDQHGNLNIIRLGVPRMGLDDIYHWTISCHWGQVILLLGTLFLSLALAFAALYWVSGASVSGARPDQFEDYFYFSVQTLATIGYGGLSPDGRTANLLVCVEAFCGLMSQAMITGIAFAKFSVPRSRVVFSRYMTIGQKDGRPALTYRLANARGNHIVDAHAKITLMRDETTVEGELLRRMRPLKLAVSETPIFAFTFTCTHYLDEDSPLAGFDEAALIAGRCEFVVTMQGLDDTVGQNVHARYSYSAEDVRWGARLADTLGSTKDGQRSIDYSKFHDIIDWPLGQSKAAENLQ